MSARDVALQIAQVVTVIALSPLLQGVILQWEERVQRARGPGIFQPYRDLWKLFHKQLVVPEHRFLDLLDCTGRRVHLHAHGTDPYPGAHRLPAAAFRYGRHPWRRPDPHAGVVCGGVGGAGLG